MLRRVDAWMSAPRVELGAALVAGALLAAGAALRAGGAAAPGEAAIWCSLLVGMAWGGRAAGRALRREGLNIDVLMVLGAGFAAWIGHPEDGSLLLVLFVLSGALEALAMQRTEREVAALHRMLPTAALVRRGEEWVEIDPNQLRPGDRVLIRQGELVPADATVASGATSVDQATLTGESQPRAVQEGSAVFAGTINVEHPIEAVVTRRASESSLQRIIDLVTRAREQREPVQRLVDRLSRPYATAVVLASAGVFLIWWRVLGEAWSAAAYTAIAVLIVASPCALVIATPTATLAAIARGARDGVLFKGGQAIERLARIGSVCFDKTGTLTVGKPRLWQVHPVAWSDGRELLAVAAALEAGSTHPIAQAVMAAAGARGVEPAAVEEIRTASGRGMSGVYRGRPVRLGNVAHTIELIPVCLRRRVEELVEKIRHRGQLAVVVAMGPAPGQGAGGAEGAMGQAGVLILSDEVRPGAAELVRQLHALGVRPVRMLTGDNRITAERVATSLGLDRWDAELLPQDKVAIVEAMKRERAARGMRGGVAVIGDGVNDAPALAAADVSVAIGSIGSDAALETADIVLLSDDLAAVGWAVRLARRARAVIAANFAVALGIIVAMSAAILIGSRVGWQVPMSVAVLTHEGGTLLVVGNSLRLLLVRGARPRGHRGVRRERIADAVAAPQAA